MTPDDPYCPGELDDGLPHGYGALTSASADVHAGTWVHGALHGKGQLRRSNGESYLGDFADGTPAGTGTYIFATGDVFQGAFACGAMEGYGVMADADGTQYEGWWADGRRHGWGLVYRIDGSAELVHHEHGVRQGEGIRWAAGRRVVQQLAASGAAGQRISLEEAEEAAARAGMPTPTSPTLLLPANACYFDTGGGASPSLIRIDAAVEAPFTVRAVGDSDCRLVGLHSRCALPVRWRLLAPDVTGDAAEGAGASRASRRAPTASPRATNEAEQAHEHFTISPSEGRLPPGGDVDLEVMYTAQMVGRECRRTPIIEVGKLLRASSSYVY